jgi:hypothetical protein
MPPLLPRRSQAHKKALQPSKLIAALPELVSRRPRVAGGHVVEPERDGSVRRVPLVCAVEREVDGAERVAHGVVLGADFLHLVEGEVLGRLDEEAVRWGS